MGFCVVHSLRLTHSLSLSVILCLCASCGCPTDKKFLFVSSTYHSHRMWSFMFFSNFPTLFWLWFRKCLLVAVYSCEHIRSRHVSSILLSTRSLPIHSPHSTHIMYNILTSASSMLRFSKSIHIVWCFSAWFVYAPFLSIRSFGSLITAGC